MTYLEEHFQVLEIDMAISLLSLLHFVVVAVAALLVVVALLPLDLKYVAVSIRQKMILQ